MGSELSDDIILKQFLVGFRQAMAEKHKTVTIVVVEHLAPRHHAQIVLTDRRDRAFWYQSLDKCRDRVIIPRALALLGHISRRKKPHDNLILFSKLLIPSYVKDMPLYSGAVVSLSNVSALIISNRAENKLVTVEMGYTFASLT